MSDTETILHLQHDEVYCPEDRLRAIDPEKVAEFAISMADVGQLTAIEVGPRDPRGHPVIFGAHRWAAAPVAGLPFIKAIVFTGTPDEKRLREIDENLFRSGLTPYDEAAFLAVRRAIFERINGAEKRGRKPGTGKSDSLSSNRQLSFFDDLLAKFGLPKRMVQRALKRRHEILPEVWDRLRGHPVTKIGSELDKLARQPEAEQRRIVKLLTQEVRPAKNISAAILALSDAPAESVDDKQFRRLSDAWKKAGAKARGEFLAFLKRAEGTA